MPPAQFIPFAEHTGYIKLLTRWVLREAVRQCGRGCAKACDSQVSVNISARDLHEPRAAGAGAPRCSPNTSVPPGAAVPGDHRERLHGRPGARTEGAGSSAELGVRLSIDDYGTGYSSLSYIMRLPVQELKIDQSFISRMATDEEISTIVRSTIDLGHNLGLKVVAEGVEDLAVWNMLRSLGCDDAQGFFMSRPLGARSAGEMDPRQRRSCQDLRPLPTPPARRRPSKSAPRPR